MHGLSWPAKFRFHSLCSTKLKDFLLHVSEIIFRALPDTLWAWMPANQIRSKQNPSDGARKILDPWTFSSFWAGTIQNNPTLHRPLQRNQKPPLVPASKNVPKNWTGKSGKLIPRDVPVMFLQILACLWLSDAFWGELEAGFRVTCWSNYGWGACWHWLWPKMGYQMVAMDPQLSIRRVRFTHHFCIVIK